MKKLTLIFVAAEELLVFTFVALAAVSAIGCDRTPPPLPSKEELASHLQQIKSFDFSDDKNGKMAEFALDELVRHNTLFVEYGLLSQEQLRDYCRQLSLAHAAWQVKAMCRVINVPGLDGGPFEVPYAYLDAVKYGSSAADIVALSGVAPEKVLESMDGFIESFGIKKEYATRGNLAFLDLRDEVQKIVARQKRP